ncbi:hypothetical protein [Herbaspirillum sp. RV1423]|uniref:hypothetical protein n=1 Tax=Herbaspirillum sp. RV1423 TaxID=1443993 RepID=UPI0009DD366D|nr:hypothetical protein [Herbaspirillum sp. RV1423]
MKAFVVAHKNFPLITILLSVLLTGCAELPQNMKQMSDTLTNMGRGKFGPTKFEQSGLANIFKGTQAKDNWPRVALTIDEIPDGAERPSSDWSDKGPPIGYCITVSATVWKSEKVSQKIDRVPFCASDLDTRIQNNWSAVLGWARTPKTEIRNTGVSRTSGPNPPARSFPNHSIIIENAGSKANVMLGGLLWNMGIDLAEDPLHEARVWVVSTVR